VTLRTTAVVLALVASLATVDAAAVAPSSSRAAAATTTVSARALLAGLPVHEAAAHTGYARTQYGTAWVDVDHNGCDTRDDVLRRDLTGETLGPDGCTVVTGRLADPYTGRVIVFARAEASAVQIDHVVALSDSWQTGAQAWPADRRRTFANDPLNLLAVDGPTNQRKGDSDAAGWLPPRTAYDCRYVARQVAVKAKYGLWVTAPEQAAMARVLQRCPSQAAPTGGAPLPVVPAAPATPTVTTGR
jgi:hypothetical protein